MPSIHLDCPQCHEEIEILMEFERGDYSVGLFGGWEPDGYVQSCACVLTADEDKALGEEAARIANAGEGFGEYPEPTYGNEMW